MCKRIKFRVYLITGIFVFVAVHYGFYAKENGISIGRYIRSISTYQPVTTTAISDSTDTPTTSCVTGKPCQYPDKVDLRVIVITFNRPGSMLKLLRSLDTLVLDGDRAALEIWIDRHRKKGVDQRTVEVASAFKWKGGPTRVHVQVALVLFHLLKAGLGRHVLQYARPISHHRLHVIHPSIYYRAKLSRARLRDCMSSVCLSVTFRYRDEIGWNYSKIISRPNSE